MLIWYQRPSDKQHVNLELLKEKTSSTFLKAGTRCHISCTIELLSVSKILTPHRLLWNWFAMAYFDAEITRSPNMFDKGSSFSSDFVEKHVFFTKKTLKKAFFWWPPTWGNLTLGGLRRCWRPKRWHLVNFWDTPENFGTWRFIIAMWEFGGIKSDFTAGHYFLLRAATVNCENTSLLHQMPVFGFGCIFWSIQ